VRNQASTSAYAAAAGAGSNRPPVPLKKVPQTPQNFAVDRLAAPQDGQPDVRTEPHSSQNVSPGSFSVPHFEQTTRRSNAT
jgi:hypothetical protein